MMKINIKKSALCMSVLCISLLVSACGAKNNNESVQEHAYPQSKQPVEEAGENSVPNADAKNNNSQGSASGEEGKPTAQSESTEPSEQIDIVIDQSEKPSEGNSFDFGIKQVPKGYTLTEMRWTSNTVTIVNSLQEAIEHGGNGEDGFYFSGNGQFSGFIYSDEMKGERGKATFVFTNDEGNEIMSEKEITLK
ncbi:hypothetical protein [Paenibacillus amylolyticus]|uniref:hypothetical protein n=1 Tax=Paenibacillus amylolyticus TaxID=1451 RepID=UPI00201D9397|nr:hypothetical protein [Paenibacillus amylolyticus]MCL6663009.1 hypothetical protein [Paenibacillus amylolyticus]